MAESVTSDVNMTKAVAWWRAIRPATLPAGLAPVVVGTALAAADHAIDLGLAVLAALGAVALQVVSNFVNDAADNARGTDDDQRVGPARAAAMGWLSERELWVGAGVALVVAGLCGVALIAAAGWPVLWVGLSGAAAAILYTAGPVPLGYVGLGDLFVMLFFGFAAVVTTVFILSGDTPAAAWAAGGAVGALATAVLVVNNLRDRHGDAGHGKRTLAVRFGARAARIEYTVLVVGAFALVPAGAALGWWGWPALVTWAALPMAYAATRGVWTQDGAALNPLLGATARLTWAYAALLALGVLL